jgi:hypothetical protein
MRPTPRPSLSGTPTPRAASPSGTPGRAASPSGTPGRAASAGDTPDPAPPAVPDPGPGAARLLALAREVDADLAEAGVEGAVVSVGTDPHEPLSYYSLDGAHPLERLLRFVAPPEWAAVGVSSTGWAHPVDASGRPRPGTGSSQVRVTVLIDRSGAAGGVLHDGDDVTDLPEPPQGVVADACRRALGVPTAPPPATSGELWTLAWLDRLVEVAGRRAGPALLAAWPAVAALHPAAGPAPHPPDPPSLAAAAVGLAEAWPWSRLRAEPTVVSIPGVDQSPATAEWMDDGMWARWLLAGLPGGTDLLAAVQDLLTAPVAEAVTRVATWP